MEFAIHLIRPGKNAVISLVNIQSEDGTAESSGIRKLVEMGENDVECLVTTPRKARHGTVITVGFGAESPVNCRDKVVQKHVIERCSVCATARIVAASAERSLHIATLHDHNHRHSLAFCDEIIHDILHQSLPTPARFVLTHAVLKIENGVAFSVIFIRSRRVNQGPAPCVCR